MNLFQQATIMQPASSDRGKKKVREIDKHCSLKAKKN